jgi:hypothetical protein
MELSECKTREQIEKLVADGDYSTQDVVEIAIENLKFRQAVYALSDVCG